MIAEYKVCSGVLPAPGVHRPRSFASSIMRLQLSGSSLSARTAAAAERRESLLFFPSAFASAGLAFALGEASLFGAAGLAFASVALLAADFAAARVFLFVAVVAVVFFLLPQGTEDESL